MEKYNEIKSKQTITINDINVELSITKTVGQSGKTLDWWGVGKPVDIKDSDKLKDYLQKNHKFFNEQYGTITISRYTENPFSFTFLIRGRT